MKVLLIHFAGGFGSPISKVVPSWIIDSPLLQNLGESYVKAINPVIKGVVREIECKELVSDICEREPDVVIVSHGIRGMKETAEMVCHLLGSDNKFLVVFFGLRDDEKPAEITKEQGQMLLAIACGFARKSHPDVMYTTGGDAIIVPSGARRMTEGDERVHKDTEEEIPVGAGNEVTG